MSNKEVLLYFFNINFLFYWGVEGLRSNNSITNSENIEIKNEQDAIRLPLVIVSYNFEANDFGIINRDWCLEVIVLV